jgi:hypothetical protein
VFIRFSKELLFRVTTADQRRFVRDYLLPEFLGESLRGRFVREVALGGRLMRLRRALWCGASTRAREDLERIKNSPESRPHEVAGAAWILGTFHGSLGNWSETLENAQIIRRAMPTYRALQGRCLLESDALMWLERNEDAREVLLAALQEAPQNPHLLLALANTYSKAGADFEDERLEIVNRVLRHGELEPLSKRDSSAPLGIDNLAVHGVTPVSEGPLVTVIVPAFNAAGTIGFALRSLVEQSWKNLEVLVVDDRSPDETFQVASEWSKIDPRIRCFRARENKGAYAARNLALGHARGEFITVHDADDWSHPRKIELQVRQLLEHRHLVANESDWVRAFSNLYFRGTARVSSHWITSNISSLMIRRQYLEALGGWDEVRVAGDSELQRRLMHMRDKRDLGRVLPGVPLSFALELPSSLTRRGPTHVHTISYGVRRTYHDASKHWLGSQTSALPSLPPRAFPAPAPIALSEGPARLRAVFVMDFLWPSRELRETWRCIRAIEKHGKVGIFQVARYPTNMGRRLPRVVLDAAQQGLIYIVSPGEEVECEAVFVMKPDLLSYRIDRAPRFHTEKVSLLVRAALARGLGLDSSPEAAASFAEQSFELPVEWVANTPATRKRLNGSTLGPLSDTTLQAWLKEHR